MLEKLVFRIIFIQDDKILELYAKHVSESDLFGFVVLEDLLFGEKSAVVVDPTEEKLRAQFMGVRRTYVPMQSVIRIDEVEKLGHAKMSKLGESSDNVSYFPAQPFVGKDS